MAKQNKTSKKSTEDVSNGRYYFAIGVFIGLVLLGGYGVMNRGLGAMDIIILVILLALTPQAYKDIKLYNEQHQEA